MAKHWSEQRKVALRDNPKFEEVFCHPLNLYLFLDQKMPPKIEASLWALAKRTVHRIVWEMLMSDGDRPLTRFLDELEARERGERGDA